MTKIKNLGLFFILPACLALAAPAYSVPEDFHLSLGFHGSGVWIPGDQAVRDIYGSNFLPYGFSFRGVIGNNFALEVSADFISKSGIPQTIWGEPVFGATVSMTVIPVHISAVYGNSLGRDFSFYFGSGTSMCIFREELTSFGIIESSSESTIGFHAFAGVQRFWKSLGAKAEVRYFSASIEGITENINIGGFGIYTGLMIKFGVSAK
jgi:hypothetical protein